MYSALLRGEQSISGAYPIRTSADLDVQFPPINVRELGE